MRTHCFSGCRRARRAGISLTTVLISLLVTASLTLAAASTFVAVQASAARNRADQQRDEALAAFRESRRVIDAFDTAVLTNARLKDAEPLRVELMEPLVSYYKTFAPAHAADEGEDFLPEAAGADFRLAALQAKMGSKDSIQSMLAGLTIFGRMKRTDIAPERHPSLQDSALRLVPPLDWARIKDGTSRARCPCLPVVRRRHDLDHQL